MIDEALEHWQYRRGELLKQYDLASSHEERERIQELIDALEKERSEFEKEI